MNNNFDKITITYRGICSSKKKFQGNKYNNIGLDIHFKPYKNEAIVTISSKILLEEYWRLISFTTILRVYSSVSEQLDITFEEFLSGLIIKHLEVTSDIRVSCPHSTIGSLFDLSKYQTAYKRYGDKPHKFMGLPTSFNLFKDVLTYDYRDYLSCYIKLPELNARDKRENQRLLQSLSIAEREELNTAFKNVVRLETKLQSLVTIRQHFGLHKHAIPTLWEILTSEVTVNKNMLDAVFGKVVDNREKCSFNGTDKNMFLLFTYLQAHNFDLENAYDCYRVNVRCSKPKRFKDALTQVLHLQAQLKKDKLLEDYFEVRNKL